MKKNNHLPISVESSIGRVDVLRYDLSIKFELKIRSELHKLGCQITCGPGCHWCCYHPILISILEGIIIYRWLVGNGKLTLELRNRLKDTAKQQFETSMEILVLSLIPCPFLCDTKCSIYPTRPLICRAYYAVSDPHYCHPHRLNNETTIINREPIVDSFNIEQRKILRRHKLRLLEIPIGAAILIGERVCNEKIDLDTVDTLILKEYGSQA